MPSSLKPTWSSACLGTEVADRFLAAHRALTGMDHHPFWDVACVVDAALRLGQAEASSTSNWKTS